MAEANSGETAAAANGGEAAPEITQGQTTSVAEGAEASEAQPAAPEGVAEGEQEQPSLFNNYFFWGIIALWLWWFWSRSKNNKKRKAEADRLQSLKKGDKLVTIGRMHGTVVAFTDETVTVKPDDKSSYTMTFDRQAIYRITPKGGEEGAEAPAGETPQ